jgi:release factor glutamine methyltransferase
VLVLEHGCDQRAPVREALAASGFERIECHRDLAGLDRVTSACRAREPA